MKKLAAFSVVLGAVPSGEAMAADAVSIRCEPPNPPGPNDVLIVLTSQASAGVTLPPSCAANGPSCSQCFADLLTNRFTLQASQPFAGTGGPFFVFSRGGGQGLPDARRGG